LTKENIFLDILRQDKCYGARELLFILFNILFITRLTAVSTRPNDFLHWQMFSSEKLRLYECTLLIKMFHITLNK